jgi:ubiquinone/menaquinone biosynthesis C-methylase UbiE
MGNTTLSKDLSFPFPPQPGSSETPLWTGKGFQVGDSVISILSYEANSSGWTDDLTTFHEEVAGNDHFIDLASRDHCLQQLIGHLNQDERAFILEVGCSSGFMLKPIQNQFPRSLVIGSDIVKGPLEKLAGSNPTIPLLHFDLTTCPLYTDSVNAVVMLNVLEHIKEDELALKQVFRILKPGGIVVIEVPAGPDLYDVYDKLLLHHRRYSMGNLVKLAKGVGFNILNQSHLGFFLYPFFYLVKKQNKSKQNEIKEREAAVVSNNIRTTKDNPLLKWMIKSELFLGNWISYPIGIRCLLTLQKPIS